MILPLLLAGFVLAFVSPWLYKVFGRAAGWVFALWPAVTLAWLLSSAPGVAAGAPLVRVLEWAPQLGISLDFRIDGLALLFACMITGIGILILIYTSAYMAGNPRLGRFYMYLLLFMVAMVGTVTSNNLLAMFVFWELTGISSYLLIGFNHEFLRSRDAALQALLVTGGGGLAMLAGILMLGSMTGTYTVTSLFPMADAIRGNAQYLPMIILLLLGAFTKSAQVPFHFWLPNAMVAPTPVSAYLHSSTMVKLGIFLVARLTPALGGTPSWQGIITVIGGLTMLTGAFLAIPQTDLKRILAYSTISVLGLLMMLLGVGTQIALIAMCLMMIAHAMYKGGLFMVAGAVDHEAGTRNVLDLGGLGRLMPCVAVAAVLCALSMAGIIPFFGFVAKEVFYESVLDAPAHAVLLTVLSVLANVLLACCAGMAAVWPFFGAERKTPKHAHNGPLSLWLGPLVLSLLALGLGFFPNQAATYLFSPAVSAIRQAGTDIHLALWHGFNGMLALSVLTVVLAVALLLGLTHMKHTGRLVRNFQISFGPNALYFRAVDGIFGLAAVFSNTVQHGKLRIYILIMTVAGAVAILYGLLAGTEDAFRMDFSGLRLYEAALALGMLIAVLVAVKAKRKLAAVTALSVVGYGMGVIYILYGAPDLALTQFAIESLSLILLVLIIYRVPVLQSFSPKSTKIRDAIAALALGAGMTGVMLAARAHPGVSRLAQYFNEHSFTEAHGRNIVNVILVDFRGFDTLGESSVLGIAGLGIYALLKLRPRKKGEKDETVTHS